MLLNMGYPSAENQRAAQALEELSQEPRVSARRNPHHDSFNWDRYAKPSMTTVTEDRKRRPHDEASVGNPTVASFPQRGQRGAT